MKVIDVPQGSAEWFQARAGIPTASEFHRLLTPKKLEMSSQAFPYLNRLLGEWLTGMPYRDENEGETLWMSRGKSLEEEAVRYYEMLTGQTTQKVGFCVTDDGRAGCSPDRLVGEDGMLEVKCHSLPMHIGYLLAGGFPEDHRLQTQGQLYVAKGSRAWGDVLAYYPGLPHILHRCTPINEVQAALKHAIAECWMYLTAGRARLTTLQGERQ